MKIKDCYQCFYNHWGLGIGVGVAACTRFLKALSQVFCPQAASPGKNTFRRHGLSLPITNVPFSVAFLLAISAGSWRDTRSPGHLKLCLLLRCQHLPVAQCQRLALV